eukprot:snap_masked-scaffold_7-processed-gene-12.25-mRNA-1 protein AED:1.00 eAED:1.00 QI:0/0/0/0/1/1/2/0/262
MAENKNFTSKPEVWVLCRSNRGELFYYNQVSQETSWNAPVDDTGQNIFFQNGIAVNDRKSWLAYNCIFKNENKIFYHNIQSGEKTFQVYAECVDMIPVNDVRSWIGFRIMDDDDSISLDDRELYFLNKQTKELTWVKPAYVDLKDLEIRNYYPPIAEEISVDEGKDLIDSKYDLTPEEFETARVAFKELLKETQLRPYSLFENWYEKFSADERCQRIPPTERALLFQERLKEVRLDSIVLKVEFQIVFNLAGAGRFNGTKWV